MYYWFEKSLAVLPKNLFKTQPHQYIYSPNSSTVGYSTYNLLGRFMVFLFGLRWLTIGVLFDRWNFFLSSSVNWFRQALAGMFVGSPGLGTCALDDTLAKLLLFGDGSPELIPESRLVFTVKYKHITLHVTFKALLNIFHVSCTSERSNMHIDALIHS